MKHAELHYRSFDGRRQFEWKIAFGFWTLVALGIAQAPPERPTPWAIIAIFLGVAYFFWLRNLWKANQKDKQRQIYFANEAEKFLVKPGHKLEKEFEEDKSKLGIRGFLSEWAVQFHLTVTLVLLIAFVFLAGTIGQSQQRRSAETETGQLNTLVMSTAKTSAEAARSAAEAAKSASEAAKLASEIARASLQGYGTEKFKKEAREPGRR
jgi:hypothetical protein